MIPFKPFDNVDACFMGRDESPLTNRGEAITDLFLLNQVHGDEVVSLRQDKDVGEKRQSEADAVICCLPEVCIAIKTADCVPILMAHPEGVIAAIHAGWKGTDQRILTKVLHILKKEFQLSFSKLMIAIGPAISKINYQVDNGVAQRFKNEVFKGVVQPQGEKFLLDLKKANLQLAQAHGVPIKNIKIHPQCTFQGREFYSYRRSQKEGSTTEGRNYSWIKIIKKNEIN